jgi:DNA (cytosine-5)-methyltransferase 1
MLNGLSLFSGIGGIDVALSDWVRPIAYCEIDPYCQGVLLNHMATGFLSPAPIWPDIRGLHIGGCSGLCREYIDIIYGGFPCQDISVAGRGKGLAGERSGLYKEILRISQEIKPTFLFLENVPAITSRGGLRIVREIAEMGYDCRWCVISAASVGALHKRERWFLLANAKREGSQSRGNEIRDEQNESQSSNNNKNASNPPSMRCDKRPSEGIYSERQTVLNEKSGDPGCKILNFWENSEPPVCGVAHGLSFRVDQIRALGNSVCPQQAKEAFKMLMGFK